MLEVARWRLNKTNPEQGSADTQSTVRMGEFAELKRFEDPTDMVGRNENLYEEMADALICFDLLVEIYGLKPSDLQTIRCGAWKREVLTWKS